MSTEKRGAEFDTGDYARANAERGGLPAATMYLALDQFAAILPEILAEHKRVELPFGVIRLKARKSRAGKNFGTGEPVVIPPYLEVKLRAADAVTRAIEELTEMPVR